MGQFLNSKEPYDLHTQTRRAPYSKHSFCLHPSHRRLRFCTSYSHQPPVKRILL